MDDNDCDSTGIYCKRFSFRISGVPKEDLLQWEYLLRGLVTNPPRRQFKSESYVICVGLQSTEVAHALISRLSKVEIPYEHGVWVSMVSTWSANRMAIPEYVIEVYREIGASMDFAFTVVIDTERKGDVNEDGNV